ncbi:hypothetical protein D3C71_1309390 [compost metagenome]
MTPVSISVTCTGLASAVKVVRSNRSAAHSGCSSTGNPSKKSAVVAGLARAVTMAGVLRIRAARALRLAVILITVCSGKYRRSAAT